MTYAELKANVRALLNRRDVTSGLIDTFTKQGIQRVQRILSVPAMEQIGYMIVDDTFSALPVPGDYLKMVSLSINGIEAKRTSLVRVQTLLQAGAAGDTYLYARNGFDFLLAPVPQIGDEIDIVYNADFSSIAGDDETNWLTEVIPDVVTYAALVEACAYFSDPRGDKFEQMMATRVTDLNLQAANDELTDAQMSPGFNVDLDNGGW